MDMGWRSEVVAVALKASEKKTARQASHVLTKRAIMDEKQMTALINNASQIGWRSWFSDMLIILWMYLLRVQSEGLKVFAGSDADAISFPDNVDAGFPKGNALFSCACARGSRNKLAA